MLIAGDHLQLPPVIKTDEAKELGLEESFMEHMVKRVPSRHFMLETQFRSNFEISAWSSKVLYDSRLRPHNNNKSICLGDLTDKGHDLLRHSGLIWFDTTGFGMKEGVDLRPDYHESANNPGESKMVAVLYKYLTEVMGIKNEQIGIIAPHWAQTATIRADLAEVLQSKVFSNKCFKVGVDQRSVELRTIDGYQGREKEVMIVSMVRANEKFNTGLFEDIRRMNVAITRAKRLCLGYNVLINVSET